MRWFGRPPAVTVVPPPPARGDDDISVTVAAEPSAALLDQWDGLVATTPGSDVAQLSGWARLRAQAGYRPLYLFASRDAALVGGALIVVRALPLIGELGYVSNGPVVAPHVPRDPVVAALSDALTRVARSRLSCLFVQPPSGAHDLSQQLLARGFRPSESGIAPAATIRLDLRRDVEELRGGLAKGNRKRTRTWPGRGVVVRRGSAADLPTVADLLARTASLRDFGAFSLDYVRQMYQELESGGHVVVFIAEMDGAPAAFRLFTASGGVLKQRLSAVDRSSRALKEGVAAATVWHAMLWAKCHGFDEYDFGGITVGAATAIGRGDPVPAGPLEGIDRFKASFGGRPYWYPAQVELIPSTVLRVGYDAVRRSPVGDRITETAKRMLRGGRRKADDPSSPSILSSAVRRQLRRK
jgi:lipid II:glycine glycyltransferase (peptidoglycan interpeptide bridge formation enzyme)